MRTRIIIGITALGGVWHIAGADGNAVMTTAGTTTSTGAYSPY